MPTRDSSSPSLSRLRAIAGLRYGMRPSTASRQQKLVFPTTPIRIHWDAQDYVHAVISFGPSIPELEAHIGVRVEGTSGVEHECDVLVLEASEARNCRSGLRSPKASKCVLAVECKYYLSHLPLGVARSFAGLKKDLAKPELIFASDNNSGSVNAYFNKHSYTRELGAGPRSREADHLRSHIRNGFRTHVATHDPGYPI